MITVDDTPRLKQGGKYEFSFRGLSSDTKPNKKYLEKTIANGSIFIEIDTKHLYYYDESSETWV